LSICGCRPLGEPAHVFLDRRCRRRRGWTFPDEGDELEDGIALFASNSRRRERRRLARRSGCNVRQCGGPCRCRGGSRASRIDRAVDFREQLAGAVRSRERAGGGRDVIHTRKCAHRRCSGDKLSRIPGSMREIGMSISRRRGVHGAEGMSGVGAEETSRSGIPELKDGLEYNGGASDV